MTAEEQKTADSLRAEFEKETGEKPEFPFSHTISEYGEWLEKKVIALQSLSETALKIYARQVGEAVKREAASKLLYSNFLDDEGKPVYVERSSIEAIDVEQFIK